MSEPLSPQHEAQQDMPEGEEPPPRGTRVMAIVRWTILAAMAVVAAGSWWSFAAPKQPAASAVVAPKYRCPMHPQIVSDKPGECPICHMTLVPIDDRPAATPADAGQAPETMAMEAGTMPGMQPPGTAAIDLPLDRVQAIGVRTALVVERAGSIALRVTASIAAADQAIAEVHVRSAGFVERIPVDQIGVSVANGQELLAVYSAEVYQAETELLTAKQWSDAGNRTFDAARSKLELLGVDTRDIDRIVANGAPLRAMPIYAPQSGVVTKKTALRGGYVTPDMALYTIEDRSRVYVVADVFAQDVSSIHVGTRGRFTLRQRPDITADAPVDLIYPSVEAASRTTRVRMTVPNPRGALRPGDYGDVEFSGAARRELVVPHDAVIDTGAVKYVFVVDTPGHFTPRTVDVGREQGNDVVVLGGLNAGDRVVSGATFLVDSESRLQGSLGPGTASTGGAKAPRGNRCDASFDRAKYPDKWGECTRCAIHRGMGSMEDDCINAIPKPWK
jgi:Cu(I)/Ag(I) efflux system membrane fusion protein